MIELRGLGVDFDRHAVLHDIDLTARGRTVTGVLGPNGSGKSTLLAAMYRALEISGATVHLHGLLTVDGEPLAGLSRREIARRIAVVAQHEPDHLGLRAIDVVDLGRLPHRRGFGRGLGPAETDDVRRCEQALARVGAAHLAYRFYAELSGGEKQRVVVARALAQDTTHLLLDEPTNHLDLRHQFEVCELVAAAGRTTVMVLHDVNLALRHCDAVVVLDAGRIVAAGPPAQILTPELLQRVWGVRAELVATADGPRLAVLGPIQGHGGDQEGSPAPGPGDSAPHPGR